jgi:hypothetical protein
VYVAPCAVDALHALVTVNAVIAPRVAVQLCSAEANIAPSSEHSPLPFCIAPPAQPLGGVEQQLYVKALDEPAPHFSSARKLVKNACVLAHAASADSKKERSLEQTPPALPPPPDAQDDAASAPPLPPSRGGGEPASPHRAPPTCSHLPPMHAKTTVPLGSEQLP